MNEPFSPMTDSTPHEAGMAVLYPVDDPLVQGIESSPVAEEGWEVPHDHFQELLPELPGEV